MADPNDFDVPGDAANAPYHPFMEKSLLSDDFFERLRPQVEYPGDPGAPGHAGGAPLRLLNTSPDALKDEEDDVKDAPGGDDTRLKDIAKEARLRSLLQQEKTEMYKTAVSRSNPVLGAYDTGQNFQFEGFRGAQAYAASDLYRTTDADATHMQPDEEVAAAFQDSHNPAGAVRTVVNFLASDEMGLLGMKWDEKGFSWSKENFINQVTEHPYASAFTVAADLLAPVASGWWKGAKVAARAAELGKIGGRTEQGLKYTFEAASTRSLLGTQRFDNHALLVKNIAFGQEGRRLFGDEMIAKLRGAAPDEVEKLVSRKDLNRMLIGDYWDARHLQLLDKAARNYKGMTMGEKAAFQINRVFRNGYTDVLVDPERATIEKMNKWYEKQGFGALLSQVPTGLGRENQELWYKWMMNKASREELAKGIGETNVVWAEALKSQWTDLFKRQAESGFLEDDTIKLFSEDLGIGHHLPAVDVNTPGFTDLGVLGERISPTAKGGLQINPTRGTDVAKLLGGPTTMRREERRTVEGVLGQLGNLEVDPKNVTVGGYIKDALLFKLHEQFRELIVEGGIKGNEKLAGYVKKASEIMPNERKFWYDMSELNQVAPGLSERMRRMVEKEALKQGLDPKMARAAVSDIAIDKHVVEDMFGQKGASAAWQTRGVGRIAELLTAVNKTMSTALNPVTQFANITGNMVLQMMGGMNPWSKQSLNDGKNLASLFIHMAKGIEGETGKLADRMTVDFMGKKLDSMGARYIKGVDGSQIDVAEFLADPKMAKLLETQSFESVEGLNHVKRVLKEIEQHGEKDWSDKATKRIAAAIAGVGETPGIRQTLHGMSAAYLGGDMIPKMQYALHLRRKGWGTDAIVREIGRRMPQYATVGALPQATRRVILPWITFPAEMTRIMKNNMMDSPITTSMWLQAPQVLQGLVSAAGLGPAPEDMGINVPGVGGIPGMGRIQSWMQPFADKYQSVVLNEGTAPEFLGAVGGATMGGLAGMLKGGAAGAAIGAAAGGAAGLAAGHYGQTEQDASKQFYRSWMVDFLPQSALFPASLSPLQWAQTGMPGFGPGTGGGKAMRAAMDLLPVEPFAMLTPLMNVWMQQGAFGKDIPSTGFMQSADKMALGLLGFISPPLLQKYGMKLEGDSGNPIEMADIFDANGGQATLPKAITATMWGLAAGGLAYAGAKGLPGVTQGARVAAGLGMGALATMGGAEMNVHRLLQDIGIFGDQNGKHGEWTMDALFNSFFGSAKSWQVSPAQGQFQETMRSSSFENMRTVLNRDFGDGAENGMESKMIRAASAVRQTFLYEYGNTELADQKFLEWTDKRMDELMRNPAFRGLSEEQLLIRRAALREALDTKTRAYNQQVNEVEAALLQKRAQRARHLKIVK